MSWPEPRWPRRLSTPAVVALATLGPLGRIGPGPGTLGSLAGIAFFAVALARLPAAAVAAVALVLGWLAVGLCGEAERRLGERDPGRIILDEFVAMPLCLLGWPSLAAVVPAWAVFALAFGLFRLFDIAKPFGIRSLQSLPGGWGVVLDDTAAALASCAALHLGVRLYALA